MAMEGERERGREREEIEKINRIPMTWVGIGHGRSLYPQFLACLNNSIFMYQTHLPSLYLIILGRACQFLFMFTKPRITAQRLKFGIKWSSSEAARLCPASARKHDLKHKCLSSLQEPARGHLRKGNIPWVLGSRGPICPISSHNS